MPEKRTAIETAATAGGPTGDPTVTDAHANTTGAERAPVEPGIAAAHTTGGEATVIAERGGTHIATRAPYELHIDLDGKPAVVGPAGVQVTAAQADQIRAAAKTADVPLVDPAG